MPFFLDPMRTSAFRLVGWSGSTASTSWLSPSHRSGPVPLVDIRVRGLGASGVCSSRSSLLAGFMRPDGPGRGAGTMSHTDERSFSSPGPLRFTPLSHWIPLKQAGSRRAWAGPPKAMATVAGPNPHFCNPPHPSSSLARIVCSYHRRQQFTWPSYAYFAIRRV